VLGTFSLEVTHSEGKARAKTNGDVNTVKKVEGLDEDEIEWDY